MVTVYHIISQLFWFVNTLFHFLPINPEISARASMWDREMLFTISDNGRGFELSGGVDDLPRSGKLGLAGMQERARLLGGSLEVKSTPDKGTNLKIEVPG
jgi:signal transduction histidine kinase